MLKILTSNQSKISFACIIYSFIVNCLAVFNELNLEHAHHITVVIFVSITNYLIAMLPIVSWSRMNAPKGNWRIIWHSIFDESPSFLKALYVISIAYACFSILLLILAKSNPDPLDSESMTTVIDFMHSNLLYPYESLTHCIQRYEIHAELSFMAVVNMTVIRLRVPIDSKTNQHESNSK